MKEAEKLIAAKIHPQTIIAGWRKAVDVARTALANAARDNGSDEVAFKNDLVNIARTTLSSKILTNSKQYFSELAVDAILRIRVGCVTVFLN